MITPDEFRRAFARVGLVLFTEAAVLPLPIAKQDADWLVRVGLPRSAAPCLSFGGKDEVNIPTLNELWRVEGGSQYRILGSNGSGDPVAIDTATAGEIVYLNHDNHFERVFINSSVTQLAESLLAYARLIAEAQAINGIDAFLDGKVPPETRKQFVSLLGTVDQPALLSGMWVEELEQLDARAAAG
jgi:hypothetical protein